MRTTFPLALLLASLTLVRAQAPTAAPTVDPSTVLLYHFDEGQGTQVADATGRHPATVSGATWVDGKFGRALRWGEGNGQLHTPAAFAQVTDRFTLQCWVKLDQLPTGQVPFWTADVCGQLGSAMLTIRPPGLLYVGVFLGAQPNYLMGQTKLPVGEWTHVAVVYDGPYRKLGLFVNGQLDTEFDVALGSPRNVAQSANGFWARSYGGGDEKLVGAIDEVCLSNRAETFGYHWRSNVYLHLLRYQSAFLVGSGEAPAADDPLTGYTLAVTGAGGKPVVERALTVPDVAAGAVVPAPGLAAGDYLARVTARHRSGKAEVVTERKFHFTPPARELVDLTADNVCLVKGKPFFPLGAYHVRQEDLATVRDGGFNTAFAFTATVPPGAPKPHDGVGYLEQCGKTGLMGVGIGGADASLKHYRGSRDVLMWYVADEPGGPGEGPEDMQASYERWAEADPTHPYFLLQNKPGEFMRYAHPCDLYATDPYPIRKEEHPSLEQVARYTEGAVAAVYGRKPVWVALQCYTVKAVSDAGKYLDGLPRLPSAAELRCMSYLALAAGARGLLYYAFDDSYYNNGQIRGVNLAKEYPDFWHELSGVIGELGAHQRIWTGPYATLHPEAQSPDIVVQSRPLLADGKAHVLVVNPQYEPRAVRVSLPGCRLRGPVPDALGGAPGQVAGGELTDTLPALGAKCYELAR